MQALIGRLPTGGDGVDAAEHSGDPASHVRQAARLLSESACWRREVLCDVLAASVLLRPRRQQSALANTAAWKHDGVSSVMRLSAVCTGHDANVKMCIRSTGWKFGEIQESRASCLVRQTLQIPWPFASSLCCSGEHGAFCFLMFTCDFHQQGEGCSSCSR